MPICSSIFPTLSCSSFKVSHFILKSSIHFELIFVHRERHGFSFRLLHVDILFFPQHLLKRRSFFCCMFWALCQKSGGCSCMDMSGSSILFLCLFLCQYHAIFIGSALQYFEFRYCDTSSFALLVQYTFVYSWSFILSYEF
jgi:hypothetical protein